MSNKGEGLFGYDPQRDTYLIHGAHHTTSDPTKPAAVELQFAGAPDGYPVVFFHGTFGTCLGPRPDDETLRSLGVRLVSIGRAYYGRSEGYDEPSPSGTVADVRVITDKLGIEEFSVIGRSGGSPHALACAAGIRGVKSAAVLASASPLGFDDPDIRVRTGRVNRTDVDLKGDELFQSRARLVEDVRQNPAAFFEYLRPDLQEDDLAVIGRIGRQLLAAYALAAEDGPEGYYYDSLVNLGRIPWGFRLGDVKVPTLVWQGNLDPFVSFVNWDYLTRELPAAEGQLEAGASHFGAFERLPLAIAWCLSKALAQQ